MKENYIDDVKTYPALVAIMDKITRLDKNKQKYLRNFLNLYKVDMNNIKLVYNTHKDYRFNNILVNLIRKDYIERINLSEGFEEELKDHVKNYMWAKSRNLLKNK